MSILKTKVLSAPINGATVEPLTLQTNDIDRVTIAADGTVTAAAGFTDSSNRLRPLVSDTAKASTSGTSVDFTGIPSWAKRITVMLDNVSLSGVSNVRFQLGDSGGIETTGYASISSYNGSTNNGATSSTGFDTIGVGTASLAVSGQLILSLLSFSANIWTVSGVLGAAGSPYTIMVAGSKTLSATLDRLRITTVNGTDTFDAGTINIMWE